MKRFAWVPAMCALYGLASAAEPPRAVPLTETTHGITLADEYRWMEDPAHAAEMSAWVEAEAAEAREVLAALPERARFAATLKDVSSSLTRVRDVQIAGRTTIFRRQSAGDRAAKLIVVRGGKESVLFDPNADAQGAAMGAVSLSPDGQRVAIHVSSGGSEVGHIQVFATATGAPVGKPLQNIWGEFPVEWLGGDWIAYTQMAPAGESDDPLKGMRAYVKRLGDAGPGKRLLGPGGTGPAFDAEEFPYIGNLKNGWSVAIAGGARADFRFWITRTDTLAGGKPKWLPVATLADRVGYVAGFRDQLFQFTTATNPAGTIVSRRLSTRGLGAPSAVLQGGDGLLLQYLAAARDGVYVAGMTEGTTRVFHSKDGVDFDEVALPFAGGEVFAFAARADGKGILLAYSGWLQNARTIAVEDGVAVATPYASATWEGARDFQVDNLQARSADGTLVPLVVVRPAGPIPEGGLPTLLEGYGSYGISTATPAYARDYIAWTARGGAMAYCGIRGGGERGRAWHDAGRGLNKPNGHADFIACAETLEARGYAPPKGVVATGTSAGGALVPPAVMKRPELFAGLIPRVAVLNTTRLAAAPNGANQFDEKGDPATPEGFRSLHGMDAYQMLPGAKALPPTLITIGLNDNRVAPWMSAKFAARAKARFGDRQQILLRADDDSGHGVGTAEDARAAEFADIMAWAWSVSQ